MIHSLDKHSSLVDYHYFPGQLQEGTELCSVCIYAYMLPSPARGTISCYLCWHLLGLLGQAGQGKAWLLGWARWREGRKGKAARARENPGQNHSLAHSGSPSLGQRDEYSAWGEGGEPHLLSPAQDIAHGCPGKPACQKNITFSSPSLSSHLSFFFLF